MRDMMKLLSNIIARGLELRYTKFFTIYILLDTVVTTTCCIFVYSDKLGYLQVVLRACI